MSPIFYLVLTAFTCVPMGAISIFPTLEELSQTNVQCSNQIKDKFSGTSNIYIASARKK